MAQPKKLFEHEFLTPQLYIIIVHALDMYYVLLFPIIMDVQKYSLRTIHEGGQSTIADILYKYTYLGIANEKGETRKIVQNAVLFVGSLKKSGVMPFSYIKRIISLLTDLEKTISNTALISVECKFSSTSYCV